MNEYLLFIGSLTSPLRKTFTLEKMTWCRRKVQFIPWILFVFF